MDVSTATAQPTADDAQLLPPIGQSPVRAAAAPLAFEDERESAGRRSVFGFIAILVIGLFAYLLYAYWIPAPGRPGVDENGYLVGGKQLARLGSPRLQPTDPYNFVGLMWMRTPDGRYYPKYPAGLPLIHAVLFWIGKQQATRWAFAVSPVSMVLAGVAMFLLARKLVGSFYAVLATIVLATGQTTLELAEVPSSHAPALCTSLWGMYLLFCWVQRPRVWVGVLAGLLVGYTLTIRYTEGLLGLPLGMAVLLSIRWRDRWSYLRESSPVLAWALPVGALLLCNRLWMHAWTGYDATRESSGFAWNEFLNKWDYAAQHLYLYGLFMVGPLGIAGLALMFRRNWRAALLLVLWFVPGALLYVSYYWGQQAPGVYFLRFFLTLFPPVILAAMWTLRAAAGVGGEGRGGNVAGPLAAGIVTALAACAGVYVAVPMLEKQQVGNLNLAASAERVLAAIPAARWAPDPAGQPVVFADVANLFPPQLLQYLQFMGDCQWYAGDAFRPKFQGGMMMFGPRTDDPDQARLIQKERYDLALALYRDKTQSQLTAEQNKLMGDALDRGRAVYAVMPEAMMKSFRRDFVTAGFRDEVLATWLEPAPAPQERRLRDRDGRLRPRDPMMLSLRPPQPPMFDVFFSVDPKRWQVIRITRRPTPPAATQPATKPTMRATTRPATRPLVP